MKTNKGVSTLLPIKPGGTNSTMFTSCCRVAITDSQKRCPDCGSKVIGWHAEDPQERHRIRWNHAYMG